MTPLPVEKIKTIADAEKFFKHLYVVEDVSFHPDDSFDQYGKMVNGVWVPLYNGTEARLRDRLMDQVRELGVDPCEIALGVGQRLGLMPNCEGRP